MPFRNFVQIGRVAFIAYGRYEKKLCVIVDVIDQNRALVDGPCTGVPRCQVRFKQLHLTKFVIRIPHSTSSKVIRKAWKKANIKHEWEKTGWYKRLQMRKVKSKLTDFDRFKLMVYKKKRNQIIKDELAKMKAKMRMNPSYKKGIIRPQRNRHAKITKTKKEALLKLKQSKLLWQAQKKEKERIKKAKAQAKYEKKKALRDPNKPVAPKKVILRGKKLRKAQAEKAKADKAAKKAMIEAKYGGKAKKDKKAEGAPADGKPEDKSLLKKKKKKRVFLKIKPKVVRPTAGVRNRNPGKKPLLRKRKPGSKRASPGKKAGVKGSKPGAKSKKVVVGTKRPAPKKTPKKVTDPKKPGEVGGDAKKKPRQKKTAKPKKAETAAAATTQ